jgi:hypothetical protein
MLRCGAPSRRSTRTCAACRRARLPGVPAEFASALAPFVGRGCAPRANLTPCQPRRSAPHVPLSSHVYSASLGGLHVEFSALSLSHSLHRTCATHAAPCCASPLTTRGSWCPTRAASAAAAPRTHNQASPLKQASAGRPGAARDRADPPPPGYCRTPRAGPPGGCGVPAAHPAAQALAGHGGQCGRGGRRGRPARPRAVRRAGGAAAGRGAPGGRHRGRPAQRRRRHRRQARRRPRWPPGCAHARSGNLDQRCRRRVFEKRPMPGPHASRRRKGRRAAQCDGA